MTTPKQRATNGEPNMELIEKHIEALLQVRCQIDAQIAYFRERQTEATRFNIITVNNRTEPVRI